jgi:hypothetical protein
MLCPSAAKDGKGEEGATLQEGAHALHNYPGQQ